MADTSLGDRVTDLEVRYAWQEDLLQQLSDLLREQQGEIVALRRELEELRSRLETDPMEIGPADDRPPHY